MKYEVRFTSQFKKDVKLAKKQGKDIDKLIGVIEDLLLIRANRFWKAIFVTVIASKPCHTTVCLAFLGFDRQQKSHLTKLLRTEKREKYEKFLVRRTKQGFVPCEDNKPKRAGFFLFSGVLSLSTISQVLANGKTLDEKYRDHDLSGSFNGCRECHIEPDWLLIYEIDNDVLILVLNRVGSHSELFK